MRTNTFLTLLPLVGALALNLACSSNSYPAQVPLTPAQVNAQAVKAMTQAFTIVALPDTQVYSEVNEYTPVFERQVQWVLEQHKAGKVAFVTHLGDVVDNGESEAQWTNAMRALNPLLTQSALPFSIIRGNHDEKTFFKARLGPQVYTGKPWYVGASSTGLSFAQEFKVGEVRFLHVGFQMNPEQADFDWANNLVKDPKYAGIPTLVSTHDYMVVGRRSSAAGKAIWEGFVKANPQVFMVMNGHTHTEYHMVSHDDKGRPVLQMLSDYQDREHGGQGLLRLITVDVPAGEVRVQSYCPGYTITDDDETVKVDPWYEKDTNSEFTIKMNLRERLDAATTFNFGTEPALPPMPALDPIPAEHTGTHLFQTRRDGYDGTVDTQMNENNARLSYAGEATLTTDLDDDSTRVHALLRFEGIFGTGKGQIPPGSEIEGAKVLFHVTSSTAGTIGFHRMLKPWTEQTTWMDWTPLNASGQPDRFDFTFFDPKAKANITLKNVMVGGGIDADDKEALKTPDVQFTCKKGTYGTFFAVDVTASLREWIKDPSKNLGWALLNNSTDGWDFETGDGINPPALLVTVKGAAKLPLQQ